MQNMKKISVEWPEHVHPTRLEPGKVYHWDEREIHFLPYGLERNILKPEKIELIDGLTREKKEYNLNDKDTIFEILKANPYVFYFAYGKTLICMHYPKGTKFYGYVFLTREEYDRRNPFPSWYNSLEFKLLYG